MKTLTIPQKIGFAALILGAITLFDYGVCMFAQLFM